MDRWPRPPPRRWRSRSCSVSSTLSKLSKKPATWRPVRLLDAPARPPQPGVTPTPHTGPPSGGSRATRAASSCLSVFLLHRRDRLPRGDPLRESRRTVGGVLVVSMFGARGERAAVGVGAVIVRESAVVGGLESVVTRA